MPHLLLSRRCPVYYGRNRAKTIQQHDTTHGAKPHNHENPRRRTTRPPTAQAAPGKPLADHGRRTNVRGRRPGLKDNRCCRCPSSPDSLAASTPFRDHRPDIAPLATEPRRRTNQPPAAQTAQGELLADHGRRTNFRGRRPGLKDSRSCRRHNPTTGPSCRNPAPKTKPSREIGRAHV